MMNRKHNNEYMKTKVINFFKEKGLYLSKEEDLYMEFQHGEEMTEGSAYPDNIDIHGNILSYNCKIYKCEYNEKTIK